MTSARRETGSGSGLVVAAQILEWKDQIWDFWNGVGRALEAQGQQLVLLSPWAPPAGAEWPVVLPMPYAIGEFTPDPTASMARDATWDHLLATDDLYRTFLPPSRKAGLGELASLQAYVRAIFEELAPDVAMGWAPPFPSSRLILGEASRREIPSFGLEIGFLPNSVMVESHDVGFGSDLISHPAIASVLAGHVPSADRIRRIRDGYRARPRDIAGLRADTPGPMIVLLGSCPGFNMEPRDSRPIRLASPWFSTYEDAAEALRTAAPPGSRIVLRPHPADVGGQRYSRRSDAPGTLVNSLSIRTLIEQADAVVVLGSTRTQLEVALLDVPLVLLSRSVLWGQGIAHEYDGGDLASLVEAALAREGDQRRRAEADRLLDFIAAHCLYGLPGSPAARGSAEFARFLGRFALASETAEIRAERLTRFNARVAPLLASYVCREVSTAQRPMRGVYEPYLEAALVDLVVRGGDAHVIVCGTDAVAQRLGRRLSDAGVTIDAYVDDDASVAMIDGVPVRGYDALDDLSSTTAVLASHGGEEAMRRRLQVRSASTALRLVGPSTMVLGDAASIAQLDAPEHLWMARGHQHAARGDHAAAALAFESARAARPDWAEPVYRLALLRRSEGEPPDSLWALFAEALALGGDSPALLTDAGFAAFAVGDVDQAGALATRAAAAWPAASYPWHLQALCARARGATPAVVGALLDQAVTRAPVSAELALDMACSAMATGDVGRVETFACAAAEARPDWPLPRHLLALCARARGASAEEIGFWIAEAMARPPVSAELAYDAASLAHANGDLAKAEDLARTAADLKPSWSAPWYLLGLCRRARGAAAADVLDAFSHGLAAEPRTLELVIDAGFAALDAGDAPRADALAQEAHAMQPQWSVPWHLRALAARASEAPLVQVLELLYRGMRCGDASAELAFDAATVAYALRRNADATRYITQALELRPGWPDALALQRRLATLATPPPGAPS